MSYAILVRNPSNNKLLAVENGEGENTWIASFATEEAEAEVRKVPVCRAWPYVIVEAP